MWSPFFILVFQKLHLIWSLIYQHTDNFHFSVTDSTLLRRVLLCLTALFIQVTKACCYLYGTAAWLLYYSPTKIISVFPYSCSTGATVAPGMWFLTIIKKPTQKPYWSFLEIYRLLKHQRNILLLKTQEFAQYLGLSSAFWWRIFCTLTWQIIAKGSIFFNTLTIVLLKKRFRIKKYYGTPAMFGYLMAPRKSVAQASHHPKPFHLPRAKSPGPAEN